MTEYEAHDEDAGVWPPAIALPAHIQPRPVINNNVLIGIASVIGAGIGLICGICVSGCLWTLYAVNEDHFGWDRLIHCSYDASLILGIVGISLGLFSRTVKVGKIGLALSICLLCLMVTVTLLEHKAMGNGQWIWNTDYSDDCGC